MPTKHAQLSPSASERWIQCPASIRMEAQVPPGVESSYAAEGTAAHALAEIKASLAFWITTPQAARRARAAWEKEYGKELELWDLAEMDRHTDSYVELIRAALELHPNSQLMLEQRMDTGVPTCWGTSDAVIVSTEHVEIIDFKYGQGVRVDAEGNSQLRLYALGALDTYGDLLGKTQEIRITVHQPRLDHTSTEVLTPLELRKWRESIIPIAEEALSDNARFGPSESACRWCPASGRCKAQLEDVFKQDFEADPETLTPEQVAETLAKVPSIREWLKAFEEAALTMAYSEGVQIPGWKVIMAGGRRSIKDPNGALEALSKAGYSSEQVSKKSLVGIGELEKLLGKDGFNDVLGSFVAKSEGRPSLVVDTDKRAAASPDAEAQKEFRS